METRSAGFAGAPMLLGVAFVMGVMLTVVFPTGREFAELTGKHRVDAYSIAYLSVLTRAQRDDGNLRIVYARQLAELGRWEESLAALDAGTFDPAAVGDAKTLRLDVVLARARSLPVGSSARASALEAVHQEIRAATRLSWPPPRARELAKLSLELEDPALAARYFLAAGELEVIPSARAEAIAEAGRWLRASSDERGASECFRRAADLTDDRDHKARYLSAGADALEAQGRPCDAADLLRPFVKGSPNVALVVRAAALSTSCGNAHAAKNIGRRLLELTPDDETYVREQVGRELAAGDPSAALLLLRTLVKRHPNDGGLRLTTARVAEWSGQPQIALEQWLFLMSTGHASQHPKAAGEPAIEARVSVGAAD
jgi:tetratricopeptide (TPR) repeat protein